MKDVITIIMVNKAEAEAIREQCKGAHVRRTMVHKSKRHRYYAEERRDVMRLLNKMRGDGIVYDSSDEENISNHLI